PGGVAIGTCPQLEETSVATRRGPARRHLPPAVAERTCKANPPSPAAPCIRFTRNNGQASRPGEALRPRAISRPCPLLPADKAYPGSDNGQVQRHLTPESRGPTDGGCVHDSDRASRNWLHGHESRSRRMKRGIPRFSSHKCLSSDSL